MNCPACQAPLKPGAAVCTECGGVQIEKKPSAPRAPEDWGQMLLRVMRFDDAAVAEVASDPGATKVAVIVVMVAGAAISVGTFNPLAIVVLPFLLFGFALMGVGVPHFIATCLGGKGKFIELFRVQGLTYSLHLVGAVPVIGPLLSSFLWVLQMAYLANAVKVIHRLPLPHAVAVVVIPCVIMVFAVIAIVATLFAGLLAVFGLAAAR